MLFGSGLVASAAGLDTALRGLRSFPGVVETGSPPAESETRYYGGVYLGLGLTVVSLARRADPDPAAVRALAGMVFLGGLARLGGWRAIGRPAAAQRILLAVELAGPPALLAWQLGSTRSR